MSVVVGIESSRVSDMEGTSSGYFYAQITKLGFTPMRHEGKVLGLAAFGDPKPLHAALQRALRLAPEGTSREESIVCGPKKAVQALVDNRVDCLAIGCFWLVA